MNKTLIAAALLAAFVLLGTSPARASEPTDERTAPPRGWSEWRLVDWHGRPKSLIGEDRRTYRSTAAARRMDEPFAGRLKGRRGGS